METWSNIRVTATGRLSLFMVSGHMAGKRVTVSGLENIFQNTVTVNLVYCAICSCEAEEGVHNSVLHHRLLWVGFIYSIRTRAVTWL